MSEVVGVEKKKKKRIFYFDCLRALAIISVILYHIVSKAGYIIYPDYAVIPSFNWVMTDVLATCFRCGVDLFLMLSGALSLGRVWDIKTFLGKRIPRIVAPFLFWGFTLSLLLVVISFYYPDALHSIKLYTIKTFDIPSFLDYLCKSYMAENVGFRPYWFFWMILGTYLIMPIFNKWLLHADLKEAEYFLVFWLITCIFDFTLFTPFPIKLSYFSGPIGMVVLGYYLRHTQRKLLNNIWVSLAILIVGAFSCVFGSYLLSDTSTIYQFERYSIFLAIEVIGIFLTFKNISQLNINISFFSNPDGIFRKSVFSLAKYSYGIYLTQQIFMNLVLALVLHHVHYKMLVLLLFVGSLGISWIVMALLDRVPYINKVIGAK